MLSLFIYTLVLKSVTSASLDVFQKPQLTGDDAWKFCRNHNTTLVRMTERTQVELISLLRKENEAVGNELIFWTGHKIDIDLQKTSNSFNQIQYEPFPDNELDLNDFFCVYAMFNSDKVIFGWTMDFCNEATRSFVCESHQYDQDLEDPPLNVTMYTGSFERDQNEATSFCEKEGIILFKIDDEVKFRDIEYFLTQDPWNQTSQMTFWTGHKSIYYQETITYDRFPDTTYRHDEAWTTDYCVYAVFDKAIKVLGWRTADTCMEVHSFMCQQPLDDCPYLAQYETEALDIVADEMKGTIRECEVLCKLMELEGQLCGGFNHLFSQKICIFVQANEDGFFDTRDSPKYTFYYKACSIVPSLAHSEPRKTTDTAANINGLNLSNKTNHSFQNVSTTISALFYTSSDRLSAFKERISTTDSNESHLKRSNLTDPGQCYCMCDTNNKTVEERIKELVKELEVDKKNTSMYLRRFFSASDSRPLSKGMGLTAAAILISICVGIIAMDSQRIAANAHIFWKGLRKFLKY